MLIELNVDSLSPPNALCLNYLLKLQPLQNMRLFVSAKQANIGFVRVKSHADVLPHCSPSNLGPRFQLCHGLKLFIC